MHGWMGRVGDTICNAAAALLCTLLCRHDTRSHMQYWREGWRQEAHAILEGGVEAGATCNIGGRGGGKSHMQYWREGWRQEPHAILEGGVEARATCNIGGRGGGRDEGKESRMGFDGLTISLVQPFVLDQ
eukprot:365824-Chlamydomonas_euryale.AAC.11